MRDFLLAIKALEAPTAFKSQPRLEPSRTRRAKADAEAKGARSLGAAAASAQKKRPGSCFAETFSRS